MSSEDCPVQSARGQKLLSFQGVETIASSLHVNLNKHGNTEVKIGITNASSGEMEIKLNISTCLFQNLEKEETRHACCILRVSLISKVIFLKKQKFSTGVLLLPVPHVSVCYRHWPAGQGHKGQGAGPQLLDGLEALSGPPSAFSSIVSTLRGPLTSFWFLGESSSTQYQGL